MVNDDFLGPLGQIIVYCTIFVVVISVILIIACLITPGCIGYECVRPRKKSEQSVSAKQNNKPNDNLNLNDISYRSWRLGSLYDTENGTICESPGDSFNSDNSQFRIADSTTVMNLAPPPKQKKSNKEKEFPTEITLSLRYLPYCEGLTASKLVIGIEALSGLPPKQYNCTMEPYVSLDVFKQFWTHRKKQKLYTFKTKCIRHTANPIFRESFVIAGATAKDIRDWILNIEAYDHDRYANDTKLCELQVPFKDAKKLFLNPETHLFNLQMKKSREEFGNILLGISYLPTAQRLTIKVMKLRNVKFVPVVLNLNEFNPYVRILLLNGKTGRKIKKKKTKFIRANAEPEFNETLTFDLPVSQIDILQFLIILCSKASLEDNNVPMMNELPSDSEDSVNSFQKSKDVSIGKIALGKGVRGATERLHWFSVLQNPRKLVTVWHTLK
ncbi:PREDICTED: synaptotagmin-1-like [Ceratosolen solmsi marchali]|uniref:Synaptotagmin-1-like n=1 Tax=Ceratosolen solmsi marchali TaxID=326594 RepID=A0AAJ6YBW1_9HYME|nr:PREDICTED: synaptotagmin-1-like [Ceratosolen solmsi marchali]